MYSFENILIKSRILYLKELPDVNKRTSFTPPLQNRGKIEITGVI